jgi:LPXTG-motif cell wall-anchored protein
MRLTRSLGAAVVAVLWTCVGTAHGAPGGYGPVATGPSGTPGGYTTVVASQTFGPEGGTMTASVEGGTVTVVVPPGAFGPGRSAQVVLTEPDLSAVDGALDDLGLPGWSAELGVGLKALDEAGEPIEGPFAVPLTMTLSGPSLGSQGERVMRFATASSLEPVDAQAGAGSWTITVPSDPNFVVVDPAGAPASTTGDDDGTTGDLADTGSRAADAALLGLLLVAAGAALLIGRRRAWRAR